MILAMYIFSQRRDRETEQQQRERPDRETGHWTRDGIRGESVLPSRWGFSKQKNAQTA